MKKLFLLLVVMILACSIVYAARISGIVYDESLKRVNDVIVEINTTPKQTVVAKNGEYSFEVPLGNFTIIARFEDAAVEENISVIKEGNYIIDLILFPNLEDEPFVEEQIEDMISERADKHNYNYIFIIAGTVIVVIFIIFLIIKRKKLRHELSEDLQNLIDIVKKHGGRITQKEVRKEIPLSEAKISLMVTELEHKGIIEKIKKGRGNIIVLKK